MTGADIFVFALAWVGSITVGGLLGIIVGRALVWAIYG